MLLSIQADLRLLQVPINFGGIVDLLPLLL